MDEPFWQKAILEAIGPVITVAGGGLVANVIVAAVQKRRQDRQTREQLAVEMTQTASGLHNAIQLYILGQASGGQDSAAATAARKALSDEYQTRRVAGDALEARLKEYFASARPRAAWHAALDLLTVRYLHAVGGATEVALERNAGPGHSGLTLAELKDHAKLREAYQGRLGEATRLVLTAPSRP